VTEDNSRYVAPAGSSPFRVLVFPGGTEIALEINSALRWCKDVQLFSAGLAVSNHATYVFTQHTQIPSIHKPGWLEALNDLIVRQRIGHVFPAYDDIIVALAVNAERLHAKVVTSPLETCLITRSKSQTYRALRDTVPCPQTYSSSVSVDQFPVFVKPDKSQGSQGAHVVDDNMQLTTVLRRDPTALVLEYLPGDEYTIDCFSDRDDGLLFCAGRERTRTRSGISMSSHIVEMPEFRDFALAISKKLKFHGAWFFQLKKDAAGCLKLLEIGPRIAGTMALHRVLGVNFPLLSLYEAQRMPVRIMTNLIQVDIDRALINRYHHNVHYNTVYVDLDDTLIFKSAVNTKLIAFLYQCINEQKKLVLLTRHTAEVEQTLRNYRLAGIFDEIIRVPPRPARKSQYITENNSILIDDSFSERYATQLELGLPTFDCSMLEMLIDDRV
jgi:carbamoyl-phosphate synthase large subunit